MKSKIRKRIKIKSKKLGVRLYSPRRAVWKEGDGVPERMNEILLLIFILLLIIFLILLFISYSFDSLTLSILRLVRLSSGCETLNIKVCRCYFRSSSHFFTLR